MIIRQRPLVMVEVAILDPSVVDVMQQQSYHHFDRNEANLDRQDKPSSANDGFWLQHDIVSYWIAYPD